MPEHLFWLSADQVDRLKPLLPTRDAVSRAAMTERSSAASSTSAAMG